MKSEAAIYKPGRWLGIFTGTSAHLLFCQILLWVGIMLLPITSFPLLSRVSGASTVAPPSNLIFLLLLAVWLFPYLIKGGRLPVEVFFFSLFILAALLSWGAAFFIELPPFRDGSLLSQGRSALLTLLMGTATFIIVAALLSLSKKWIQIGLIFINVSGALIILWSLIQAYFVFFHDSRFPDYLYLIQHFLSSRAVPLFSSRLTGFAYEPSWLAHQLVIVYLPFWLAATISGFTTVRIRLWKFSFENILFALGFIVLFMSFSRIGFLSFMLVIAFVAIQVSVKLGIKIHNWFFDRWKIGGGTLKVTRGLVSLGIMLSFLLVYLVVILGAAYTGSLMEPRLARILSNPLQSGSVYEIANQLAFAERVVYWGTGFEVFGDYPVFGVGLGNAGFFFQEKMPTFGYALWETSQIFNYLDHIPNTKNMWVRILAETGLIGFAFFLTWYYILWQAARLSYRVPDPTLKVVGLTGQFVLVGFLLEGFSIDSFALPYFFFSAGLVAAAAAVSRRMLYDSKFQEGN
jgi:hypothetical protein